MVYADDTYQTNNIQTILHDLYFVFISYYILVYMNKVCHQISSILFPSICSSSIAFCL